MSEELIKSLERQLKQANDESAKRRGENKTLKARITELEGQVGPANQTITTLTKERDELKKAAEAAPGEKDLKIAELTGKLRTINHKAAFTKLAETKGVNPAAVDALWTVSIAGGYKPETDEPDEAKLTEVVDGLVTSQSYAFTPSTSSTKQPEKLPPGPGAKRGDPSPRSDAYVVRKSDLQDPEFMRLNQANIAEARKAGTFVLQD